MAAAVVEKNKGGRPSEYTPKCAEQAYKLCLLGLVDKEIADVFCITESTFYLWKDKHPEFSEALTRGKTLADAKVAQSLYHRALGYSHKETITATFQGKITDSMEVTKHYPPDTPAATLWLKNRQPTKWRDKVDMELTGPNGGPILTQSLDALPFEDLLRLEEIMSKTLPEVVDVTPNED